MGTVCVKRLIFALFGLTFVFGAIEQAQGSYASFDWEQVIEDYQRNKYANVQGNLSNPEAQTLHSINFFFCCTKKFRCSCLGRRFLWIWGLGKKVAALFFLPMIDIE